jgi:hypothetical protein
MARTIFILLTFVGVSSHAHFVNWDTTHVPVDRVLTNLTKRLASKTNDFNLLRTIARLHSLSYSRAASNWVVDVYTNSRALAAPKEWLGFPDLGVGPGYPPEKVQLAKGPAQIKAARQHLTTAITYYKRAAAINPTNEIVQMGLGWCHIQAGNTNEAKQALRRAVQLAWEHDQKDRGLWDISNEAIRYLMPLLSAQNDKGEVAELTRISKQAREMMRPITPLVLPLRPNINLADLINFNASVSFDFDGSGIPNRKWQWITTNAAWIVHLPQGGRVTSTLQMFGNVTFWLFWENGYHALASLDDNADGLISGDELRGIKLWHDRNSDGVCDLNEILKLSQFGVVALDTRYNATGQIPTSPTGARFMDASTRPTYDIILNRR